MCTVEGWVRSQELISRREEEKAEKKTLVKNLFVAKAVSHIVRDQGQDKKQCGPVCKMFKCAAFKKRWQWLEQHKVPPSVFLPRCPLEKNLEKNRLL